MKEKRKGLFVMKKRILCFGDSNTWGARADGNGRFDEETRWTGRLQTLLGDGYTVVEEGHNGRTTVWDDPVENRLAGLTYLWPCLESQSPLDLVVIMLGTNDLKPRFGVQAPDIAQSAGRLVDMVQKSGFGPGNTAPKVLLVSPIHADPSPVYPHMFTPVEAAKSRQFAAEYQAIARQFDCTFFDAATVASPDPQDGIHMAAKDHNALAEALYQKVLELV